MGSYGWGKHLPKELRAVSGMFLSYLQFHHVTQDDQNNISLPGWMIYEDWEIQAFSCAVSHWDYSLLPPLPSPQNITHSQPGFAPTKNLAENTLTSKVKYHRAKPATSTWASSLSWQQSMQGREITDSPRDSWEGTWSWWLPFLLLLQKRFRFFWAWVHFFSHSVGEKRDKPEGKKTKKTQRSSSETQKAGTRAGLLGSPLHKDHLYQLRTKELASLISLQLLSVFTEEKRKGVAN